MMKEVLCTCTFSGSFAGGYSGRKGENRSVQPVMSSRTEKNDNTLFIQV